MEQSGKMDWVGSELESKYLELQMSRLTAQVIMPGTDWEGITFQETLSIVNSFGFVSFHSERKCHPTQ